MDGRNGLTPDDDDMLRGLIDTLLPGGHGFPAASATGMAGPLATRLNAADAALLGRLSAGLRMQGARPPLQRRAFAPRLPG